MDFSRETNTLFEVDFRNHFLIVLLGHGWRQIPLTLTKPATIILDARPLYKEMTFQDHHDSKKEIQGESERSWKGGWGEAEKDFLPCSSRISCEAKSWRVAQSF